MVPRHVTRTRPRSRPWVLPRSVVVAIHGGAIAVVALEINRLSDGITAAGAFMVAIFVGAVTVGLVLATCLECAGSIWAPRKASSVGGKCGSCHRRMVNHRSVWVCPVCDRISAGD